jgi:PIN domain nuclease of toxin-antitoxin system
MRLLLDTHSFIWMNEAPKKLGRAARVAITNRDSDVWLSMASCWEIALKISKGTLEAKISMAQIPQFLADYRVSLLPIELKHLDRVAQLPRHHKDPFDRLLIVQAIEENLTLVSNDPQFRRYEVKRVW